MMLMSAPPPSSPDKAGYKHVHISTCLVGQALDNYAILNRRRT